MFPLGSVLLPGMLLPLHVFEERYRKMIDDVLAATAADPQRPAEFGVCLIERGSEVGGGDVRSGVGCMARILEGQQTDDGRWALLSVGDRRVRITEWLDDDPYPMAIVEDWPDPPTPTPSDERLDEIERVVRRVGALASELGSPGLPADLEFSSDIVLRSFQLTVMSPLGSLDRQRLLAAPDVVARTDLLSDLLSEQEDLMRAQLALGDPDPDQGE
jgi:Lon protease-like protein